MLSVSRPETQAVPLSGIVQIIHTVSCWPDSSKRMPMLVSRIHGQLCGQLKPLLVKLSKEKQVFMSSNANIFLSSMFSLSWVLTYPVYYLSNIFPYIYYESFPSVCWRHNHRFAYGRRHTAPFCTLPMHNSSARYHLRKLNIRTLKTNLQIKFEWGDFTCNDEETRSKYQCIVLRGYRS